MEMDARFFARKEEQPKLAVADDSGGHANTLSDAAASPFGFLLHVGIVSVPDAGVAATAGESACNSPWVVIYRKKCRPPLQNLHIQLLKI
jgi:hypothetical protein